MSRRPPQKMADGGEVSPWERLKAGNIDDPSSEAYRRWGAGSKAAIPDASPREATGNMDGLDGPADEPAIPDASPREATGRMDGLPEPKKTKAKPKAAPKAMKPAKSLAGGIASGANYGNEARRQRQESSKPSKPSKPSEPKSIYGDPENPNNFVGQATLGVMNGVKSLVDTFKRGSRRIDGMVDGGLVGTGRNMAKAHNTAHHKPNGVSTNPQGGGRTHYGKK